MSENSLAEHYMILYEKYGEKFSHSNGYNTCYLSFPDIEDLKHRHSVTEYMLLTL